MGPTVHVLVALIAPALCFAGLMAHAFGARSLAKSLDLAAILVAVAAPLAGVLLMRFLSIRSGVS